MQTWRELQQHPENFSSYLVRSWVLAAIRQFFTDRHYVEAEVPLLAPSLPQESYLEVFTTTLEAPPGHFTPAYLTTSPETWLKKLLAAGIGNCYSLTKSFRNQETSGPFHNPEFTLLEWYQVNADYHDVMKETEELVVYCLREVQKRQGRLKPRLTGGASLKISYQGQALDLASPWERLSVAEVFAKFAQIDLPTHLTLEPMRKAAGDKGYSVDLSTSWEQIYHQIFLNEIEPHLGQGQPTILYDYPPSLAALAKTKAEPPHWAERFEVYIAGIELGDCYSELTDWEEQERRFEIEKDLRKQGGKQDYPTDTELIEALKVGLPRCSGMALGVDRLVMLLADVDNIAKTMFFPAKELFGDASGQ
ncbi:MAG: EF-P lysine aminoacylase EpmA [bacterium]|nr:EF-P lysine aminoacylase EpmA [bacterium]